MADIFAENGGVYLGFETDRTKGDEPPLRTELRYVGERHLIVTGPTGSGKTRKTFLPNVLELIGWSKIIVDPRGTICKMTLAYLIKHGNECVVIDPYNLTGFGSHGLDDISLLDPAKSDDFADDAMSLAEGIIRVEGKEPHFSQSAQEWVAALILYCRLLNLTLADLRNMIGMSEKEMRALVRSKEFDYRGRKIPGMIACGILNDWEEIGVKASRFGDITHESRELLSVISTAVTQTRWLDSRAIKRDIAKGKYDFTRLRHKPVTVFLILPARRIPTHAPWLRLKISSILNALMSDMAPSRVPIMMMLDEYYALARGDGLPIVSENMAQFREFGIKLWVALQDLPQLQRLYPEKQWESFIGNSSMLSFAPSDLTTATFLSDMMGKTTVDVSSGTSSQSWSGGGGSGSHSTSTSATGIPLMLPQDIMNMSPGYAILLSHKLIGPARAYLPYIDRVRRWKHVAHLDPSRS